jgi:uncharacterized membrane protein
MSGRVLYQTRPEAAALSDYLRNGQDATLRRRRRVIGLSLFSAAMMGVVSAMQTGLLKPPARPTRWLDGAVVNDSPQAYQALSTPDALLGLVSYAVTAVLAAMGGRDRARSHPWIPLALAGKATLDAVVAAKLTYEEPTKFRAFCLLCLAASAATIAAVPMVLPEARQAVAHLMGRRAAKTQSAKTQSA